MAYNILSLDGGGSWALIEVKLLQKLFGEHATGHDVLSKFDLVTGNSGGSIVLAALAENMSLSSILNLFMQQEIRESIFYKFRSFYTPFYKLLGLGPRYVTLKKQEALRALMPAVSSTYLSDLPKKIIGKFGKQPHFLIPAFDYNLQRVNFFRSNVNSFGSAATLTVATAGFSESIQELLTLTDAAHASSTAPINYFNETAFIENTGGYYWDGAVAGYNNPVLGAVVEALVNGAPANDIVVLSVGTGATALPTGIAQTFDYDFLQLKISSKEGLKNDVRKMAHAIVAGPPDAASYVALTMLYPAHATAKRPCQKFIRANPQLQPILKNGNWHLPDGLSAEEFKMLKALDMDAVKQKEVLLIEKFCELWFQDRLPNQPIRTNRNLVCLLGQQDFSEVINLARENGLGDEEVGTL